MNQLYAELRIPVVSVGEKGKRIQKKLLGDSELLVEATPEALADCALRVLADPELFRKMSVAGRKHEQDLERTQGNRTPKLDSVRFFFYSYCRNFFQQKFARENFTCTQIQNF